MNIWILTDGRAGIDAQALGLAEAIARLTPADITRYLVQLDGKAGKMPVWWPQDPWKHLSAASTLPARAAITPPDLIIGCGRQSLYITTRFKRLWPATKVVQIQHPRCGLRAFDLVIPPEHDNMSGANVLSIIGAPNRIAPDVLTEAMANFPPLDHLPHPRVGVLIGGKSKSHDLTPATATQLVQQLSRLEQHGAQLLITLSRRTPPEAARILKHHLGQRAALFYDDKGSNPYFAILAAADIIIATSDSTNMLTEAATAGKPLLIATIDGHSKKHQALQDRLIAGLWAQPFTGELLHWTPPPFDETNRAAAEVLKRLFTAA